MTDHLGRAQERDTGLTVTSSWAHDAIRDWITSVTDDWTEQAELRRRALDLRFRIDHKESDQ